MEIEVIKDEVYENKIRDLKIGDVFKVLGEDGIYLKLDDKYSYFDFKNLKTVTFYDFDCYNIKKLKAKLTIKE